MHCLINKQQCIKFEVYVYFKQNNFISSKISSHGKQIDISRLVSTYAILIAPAHELAMVLTSKKRALNKAYNEKHKVGHCKNNRNRKKRSLKMPGIYAKNSAAVLRARKKAYLINSENINRDHY